MPKPPAPQPDSRGRMPRVEEPRLSRLAQLEADGADVPLPELAAGHHLVAHLFEVGPVASTGFGIGPVSWIELQAWQQQIGVELEPWEARLLRRLSGVYAAEARAAEAVDAPSPMASPVITVEKRASVSNRLRIEFLAMAAAQQQTRARR